ncbi:MAG: RidA family protein [Flavobacteriales bacterium]|nr:RidA family protein [Flavobacteriales bacterium]
MKQTIKTTGAPAPIGPYQQAILTNGMLFVSGQIPLDPLTGDLVMTDISAQTTQVMDNLGEVLKAAGMDFSNVVKTSIFITDMNDFAAINEVYGTYFPTNDNEPARECVQVAALPKAVNVEISAIAVAHRS